MIVLDTHVWLWWLNEDKHLLKPTWCEIIETSENIGVSAISCFEVAWLERHRRITLPCPRSEWFQKAIEGSGIGLLGVSPDIASRAVDLAEHHDDPQDRIIIATTLSFDGKLISADSKFPLYAELAGRLID